jgi:hypothetical protein
MARINTYPVAMPSPDDILIGTDVPNGDATKNFRISDIANLLNTPTILPVPKVLIVSQIYENSVRLYDTFVTRYDLPYLNRSAGPIVTPTIGTADMVNFPMVMCHGFTQSDLDNKDIYCEMLVYKKNSKKNPSKFPRVVVSNNYKIAGATNPMPWQVPGFWNRMSDTAGKGQNPPATPCELHNWTKVTRIGQQIDIRPYLDYRLILNQINYRNTLGTTVSEDLLYPSGVVSKTNFGANFAYSSIFTTLKIKFRYIIWEKFANDGRGQITEGPLSETVIVGYANPVFYPEPPLISGEQCVSFAGINRTGGANHNLGCSIVKIY